MQSVVGDTPIPFKDGYPVFSSWSQGTVKLPNMSGSNSEDFSEADKLFAQQQGWLKKNGEPNASMSAQHRRNNELTWHHRQDGFMELVPRALHKNVPHVGGASLSRQSQGGQP